MKTYLIAASLLASALATATASADEKPFKGDLGRLQGIWTGMAGPDADVPVRLTFKGSDVDLSVTLPDGKQYDTKGEVGLDETAKPHKTIDWRKFMSPDGDDIGENLSIYEFEDADTLRVCSGGGGNPRPTEFKAGEGGPPHLLILSREKPSKAAAANEPAPTGDLAKFQGAWTTRVGTDKDILLTVAFKGNAVLLKGTRPDGQDFEFKGEVELDEKAKPHKTLNWVKFIGPQGNEVPANLAIYEFEGPDAIRLCSGGPGNERPTEFKAGEGGPPNLITLKREAK